MSELFGQVESKKLRSRLLIGSVVIAVIASLVFLAVAYRLAIEFGSNLSRDAVTIEANRILQEASHGLSVTDAKSSPLTSSFWGLPQIAHPESAYGQINMPSESIALGGLKPGEFDLAALVQQHDAGMDSGQLSLDDNRYSWAWVNAPDQSLSVLLIRRSDALDSGLSLLSRRLALASTLILWLAAWAALIVSGVIAKRFNEARERLIHEATHDALTGLGNRMMFLDRHKRIVDERRANDDVSPAALLIIDLDNFKEVNDTAGPDVGDQLLIQVAERLEGALPAGSELFRYGGDEFAIWLDESDESQTRRFAERAVDLCHQTIKIDDWSFGIGASAGVARLPDDGNTLKELLRCADIALHQAKRLRCGVSFFTSSNDPDKELKIALRSQLHQAISENQFVLFYQPKVNLQDHQIRGVEALARWAHPIHGLLPPYLFIDLIEQGGVVNLFSRYVLRQAIRQLRDWLDQGWEIPIAVNLSSYNLLDVSLVDYIRDTLKEMRVPGRLLEIELTESAAMLDVASAQEIFGLLHPEGIKVSIDDFGTGMSSLAYLNLISNERQSGSSGEPFGL